MNDTGINIDPNFVIQDLLQQVNKLTADNTVLRAALQQVQQQVHQHTEQVATSSTSDKSDIPDQTK